MQKPLIAITMGDPAGVGPEVIAGAWPQLLGHCRPLVVGHPEIMRRAVELLRLPIAVEEIDSPETASPAQAKMPCVKAVWDHVIDLPPSTINAGAGQAAYDALIAAAQWGLAGRIDAICTAPLHKVALHLAGHDYPGHTELLAELCGVH